MNKSESQNLLIRILRCALNGVPLDDDLRSALQPDAAEALFLLAKKHDLGHLAADAFLSNGTEISKETASRLEKERWLVLYRQEQMRHAYQQICDIFRRGKIPYIPLKGLVVRPFYPKEYYRTSCDIDILIRREDLDRATGQLIECGYVSDGKKYHDVSLHSPSGIHLELHFSLLENQSALDGVLKDAWQYARSADGIQYEFSEDFFCFYTFAHMAYHFLSGGCGLRSLVDIWVIGHKMGLSYTRAQSLLEQAGIFKFAREMTLLADACFSIGSPNESSGVLLEYIFDGGAYGTQKSNVLAQNTASRGTASYILHRLFLPYRSMILLFPVLKKAPVLLPFCWVARIFKTLFGSRKKNAAAELKTVVSLAGERRDTVKKIFDQLGLQ